MTSYNLEDLANRSAAEDEDGAQELLDALWVEIEHAITARRLMSFTVTIPANWSLKVAGLALSKLRERNASAPWIIGDPVEIDRPLNAPHKGWTVAIRKGRMTADEMLLKAEKELDLVMAGQR
jgi:hypothetical protein